MMTFWFVLMLSAMNRRVLWNSYAIAVRGVPTVCSLLAPLLQETPSRTDVLSRRADRERMKG